MSCRQPLGERRTPQVIASSGVGQDIHSALNRHLDSLIIGNMRKNRFAGAVCLGGDRLGQVRRHGQDVIKLHGIRENLNAIGAIVNLLPHPFLCLRR